MDEEEDEPPYVRPALPVDGEPDFESGSPQDGFEYLRRVRWQASTLPDVVTAAGLSQQSFEDQRTAYVPQTPGFQAAPAGAEVRQEWVEAFVPAFTELRAALRRAVGAVHEQPASCALPPREDGDAWRALCLGGGAEGEAEGEDGDDAGDGGEPPGLGMLTSMDEVTALRVLHHAMEWVDEADSLSEQHARWLFALLARVDLPVDADTGAAVTHMCRRLCALRARAAGDGGGAREWGPGEEVSRINTVLTIADAFFPVGLRAGGAGGAGGCGGHDPDDVSR